jgi:electron transport complex protein RnfG
MKSSMKEIVMLGVILGIVSMIAALGLSITYSVTKERIAEQAALALKNAQKEIFPGEMQFELNESMTGKSSGSTIIKEFYSVSGPDKENVGYLVSATTSGYGGPIVFIIGFSQDGFIKSVKVTENTETPGLGANLSKASFLDQFNQKSISDAFIVKKDVKAITAATITSKAITNGIKAIIDLTNSKTVGETNG